VTVVVKNILDSQGLVSIVYQKLIRRRHLNAYALPSSDMNIIIVSKLCLHYDVAPYTDVARKCVCMAVITEQEFAVIPLAHKD
jgi:hypothetical protein